MTKSYDTLLKASKQKVISAIDLLEASELCSFLGARKEPKEHALKNNC